MVEKNILRPFCFFRLGCFGRQEDVAAAGLLTGFTGQVRDRQTARSASETLASGKSGRQRGSVILTLVVRRSEPAGAIVGSPLPTRLGVFIYAFEVQGFS